MPTVVGELCSAPVSIFANGSFYGLYCLDNDYAYQRETCRKDKFIEPEIGRKAEYLGNGINEDDDACQNERKDERAPEVLILPLERKDAAVERPEVEAMEYLRKVHGEECHSHAVAALVKVVPDSSASGITEMTDEVCHKDD